MPNISKLVRIGLRNIGCVGVDGLTVDLDNVVCLVGKNNSGKSTVLRAYALALGAETFESERDRCQLSPAEAASEVELEVHIPAGNCRPSSGKSNTSFAHHNHGAFQD
jgi:putative ATP-dependent endonuclease of OLD family